MLAVILAPMRTEKVTETLCERTEGLAMSQPLDVKMARGMRYMRYAYRLHVGRGDSPGDDKRIDSVPSQRCWFQGIFPKQYLLHVMMCQRGHQWCKRPASNTASLCYHGNDRIRNAALTESHSMIKSRIASVLSHDPGVLFSRKHPGILSK
jgi:hypothetical protein